MAIHFIEPPAAVVSALQTALPRIAAKASLAAQAPAISAALSKRLDVAPTAPKPISAPVHVVGLDEIVAGRDVRTAPLRLWTQLLDDDGSPAVLADVDAATMRFAAVTEGQEVRALGEQVRAAERSGRDAREDYELAVIRVPALYLTAMWLKGKGGASDVIIPSASPMSPLTAGRRYTPEEFAAALKPLAEQLLRETDPLKGG
jgi:hypothetical protein